MAHDALTELLEDTAWSDRDVLVVDLPPGTGDVVLTMLQEFSVAGARGCSRRWRRRPRAPRRCRA
jgi:Mrp family chromosome partitioning ATPase